MFSSSRVIAEGEKNLILMSQEVAEEIIVLQIREYTHGPFLLLEGILLSLMEALLLTFGSDVELVLRVLVILEVLQGGTEVDREIGFDDPTNYLCKFSIQL